MCTGDVGFTSFWNSLCVGISQHRGTYRLHAAAVLCTRKDIKVMPVVGMSQPGQFYITFHEGGDKSSCRVKTVNFLTRWLTTDCRTCPQKSSVFQSAFTISRVFNKSALWVKLTSILYTRPVPFIVSLNTEAFAGTCRDSCQLEGDISCKANDCRSVVMRVRF